MRFLVCLVLAVLGLTGCIEDPLPQGDDMLDGSVDGLFPDSQLPDSEPPDQGVTVDAGDNQCPIAAVDAIDVLEVRPRDMVLLDGSGSTDPDGPDGRPVQYVWTVTQAPAGALAQPAERIRDQARPIESALPDDVSTPHALFMPEVAGRYTLTLSVTDAGGLTAPSAACPQPIAAIQLDVRYGPGIRVEMTWNTPGDDDQTDGMGTDVDLSLRHPLGRTWNASPLNCSSANPSPDWGPVGLEGNPSMLLDDVNGAGPEIIALEIPEDTSALAGNGYRVGVHYYRADNYNAGETWGPSEVTTRIYLDGELAGEWIGVLEETGNFWEVAQIIWTADDRRVIAVDRHFAELPED